MRRARQRRPKRELLAQVADLQRQLQVKQETIARHRLQVQQEQTSRISAQRGLVVYVRALEEFNAWLVTRPNLAAELEPILRQHGLWAIKLGYDPDQDVSLTVLSPHRT